MAFRWRADDGPLLALFSALIRQKKNVFRNQLPLTKLTGSAHALGLLFCQPRVEVTSFFVYKAMGLTFDDRINIPFIYKIEIAQVVARRITKPQRTFSRFESHWLLFFIHFSFFTFFGGGGGEGAGLILLFCSCFFFLFYLFFFLFFIPLTCIRSIYKNFCNNTSYCKFGKIHANMSVKRHICDVKICD